MLGDNLYKMCTRKLLVILAFNLFEHQIVNISNFDCLVKL
jgi:hypothetical protein